MCVPGLDPLTLALVAGGTAASVAGANMNAQAQNDAIAAQNEQNRLAMEANNLAVQQEQVRQQQFEEQQVAEVAESLAKANPAKALSRVRREAQASPVAAQAPRAAYNATPKAPVRNKDIEAHGAATGKAKGARTDKITEALAMLSAMGSDFAGIGDTIERSGSDIATIGGFRRGSMDANRLETSIPAATVTPSDSMMGDLLLLGGQLAGGIGGTKLAGTDLSGIFQPNKFRPRTFTDPTIQLQNLRGLY